MASTATTKKITPQALRFWIDNNQNVLFEGKHGVGKTAMVKQAFETAGLKKWKYFSAATMDPWCDFIGIPRAVTRADGREVLQYVMNEDFADDEVEALFFDEFNRSHKKVRDAVMELIQFKSINGRKFNNLRVVWAAINPKEEQESGEKYQVEDIDPAILDRFHIHVKVPYWPDRNFFESTYGEHGKSAVDWWVELPQEQKNTIAPRRLEYALQMFEMGGNVAYVLPTATLATAFNKAMKNGSITQLIEKYCDSEDVEGAKTFLKDVNNLDTTAQLIRDNKKVGAIGAFFLPLFPLEKLITLASESMPVLRHLVASETSNGRFSAALDSIVAANQNHKMIRFINENRSVSSMSVEARVRNIASQMKSSSSSVARLAGLKFIDTNLAEIKSADAKQAVVDALIFFLARSRPATQKLAKVKRMIKNIGQILNASDRTAIIESYAAIGSSITF